MAERKSVWWELREEKMVFPSNKLGQQVEEKCFKRFWAIEGLNLVISLEGKPNKGEGLVRKWLKALFVTVVTHRNDLNHYLHCPIRLKWATPMAVSWAWEQYHLFRSSISACSAFYSTSRGIQAFHDARILQITFGLETLLTITLGHPFLPLLVHILLQRFLGEILKGPCPQRGQGEAKERGQSLQIGRWQA